MKIYADMREIRKRMPYRCGKCRRKTKRNDKHDAYYCGPCNRWTEKTCGDAGCDSCHNRPAKPLKRKTRA